MNGESYRYIAPAPTRPSPDNASSPSNSNLGYDGASAGGHRRKLAVACDACRQRKQKCDGQRPICTPCKSRKTECSYETQPDETRYSAIKRKTENLEKETQAYKELLTSLRVRPEDEAQDLLQRIRNTRTFNIGSVLDASRKSKCREMVEVHFRFFVLTSFCSRTRSRFSRTRSRKHLART